MSAPVLAPWAHAILAPTRSGRPRGRLRTALARRRLDEDLTQRRRGQRERIIAAVHASMPQPGPGAGWLECAVAVSALGVDVIHKDGEGKAHRGDGPARLVSDLGGALQVVQWSDHGRLHRVDGPAVIYPNDPGSDGELWWRGQVVRLGGEQISYRAQVRAAAAAFVALVAQGLSGDQAMAWVVAQALLEAAGHQGRAALIVADVREGGGVGHLLREAAAAGITDPGVLGEVAHGRLPLSWATAGF